MVTQQRPVFTQNNERSTLINNLKRILLRKKILGFSTLRASYYQTTYNNFFFGKFNKRIKGFTKTLLLSKMFYKKTQKNHLPKTTIRRSGCGFILQQLANVTLDTTLEHEQNSINFIHAITNLNNDSQLNINKEVKVELHYNRLLTFIFFKKHISTTLLLIN